MDDGRVPVTSLIFQIFHHVCTDIDFLAITDPSETIICHSSGNSNSGSTIGQ